MTRNSTLFPSRSVNFLCETRRTSSSVPSSAGDMSRDESDPRRVWLLGFPRPLFAGMMKAFMNETVVAICGEGAAALSEFHAGNTKKHCCMAMHSNLDVNNFAELRGQANNWVDPRDQSVHKITTRHGRSKAGRDLGQHTSVLWKSVKDLWNTPGRGNATPAWARPASRAHYGSLMVPTCI